MSLMPIKKNPNKLTILRLIGPLAKAMIDGVAQAQTSEEKKRAEQKKNCGACGGGK